MSHPRIANTTTMRRHLERIQIHSPTGEASRVPAVTSEDLPSWFPSPHPDQARGSTANLDLLITLTNQAVSAGVMSKDVAMWGVLGHLRGFDIGMDVAELPGFREHSNHASADLAREKVTSALEERLELGKTLGPFPSIFPKHGVTFPLGAVMKKVYPSPACSLASISEDTEEPGVVDEPAKARPISDHRKSGLNSVARKFPYTQDTVADLDASIVSHSTLGIQDVAHAFPTLPLWFPLWPWFLFHWYSKTPLDLATNDYYNSLSPDEQQIYRTNLARQLDLYLNVCADFGASTLPFFWWFYLKYFVFALCDLLSVRTPDITYVDDLTHIFLNQGLSTSQVEAQTTEAMDKIAQVLQLVGASEHTQKRHLGQKDIRDLGWIYNTDCVPPRKTYPAEKKARLLVDLNDALDTLSGVDDPSDTLSTPRAQPLTAQLTRSICGQILHASGDDYMQPSLAEIFILLRVSSDAYLDIIHVRGKARRALVEWRDYLEQWDGVIILHNSHHPRPLAPPLFTDASGGRNGGGGYVTFDSTNQLRYAHWTHDKSLRRHHINYLEGWAVLKALQRLGPNYIGCDVPLYLDNLVFHDCLVKKRSPSDALNSLLKPIMQLCRQYNCRLVPFYISTESNILADCLSRQRLDEFWAHLDEFVCLPWWGYLEGRVFAYE